MGTFRPADSSRPASRERMANLRKSFEIAAVTSPCSASISAQISIFDTLDIRFFSYVPRTDRRRARRRPARTPEDKELTAKGSIEDFEGAPASSDADKGKESKNPPAATEARHIPDSREVEPSKVIETLKSLVNRMKSGESVDDLEEDISKYVTNHQQRSELIDNLVQSHHYDRLVAHLEIRDRLEKFLFQCIGENALKPNEALAFLTLITKESQLIESRVRGGTSAISDLERMLTDVDSKVRLDEKSLQKKFAKTSPQTREVMRRVAHQLMKASGKARPTG